MNIKSVNIGAPITVPYRGKAISTAIFKKPVDTPIYISKTGLEGDTQVDLENHGGSDKAVYAFSSDHYQYWQEILGRPLNYGVFGENLTISGLDETQLHIGDQLRIGEVILEVSQPRVPCYKLGIVVDNPQMPKLFTAHGATGIYFRVICQGYVTRHAPVEPTHSADSKITIHQLFNAYFDKGYNNRADILKKSHTIPQLSEEWRSKLSDSVATL